MRHCKRSVIDAIGVALGVTSAKRSAITPEEFAAALRAETAKWAKVARAAGIRPE